MYKRQHLPVHPPICSSAYFFTHLHVHSSIYSPNYLFTLLSVPQPTFHPPTCSPTYPSPTHLFTNPHVHPPTCSPTYPSPIHLFTHPSVLPSIHSFSHLPVHPPTCSPIYLFTHVPTHSQLTRMICHRRPSTRWAFPADRSSGPMLTVVQPMEPAELIASVKFSCFLYTLRFCLFRLMARSSIVLGTEWLISLLKHSSQF